MALEKVQRGAVGDGFKFINSGDNLKGFYLGTSKKEINGTPVDVHSFKTANGATRTVLGQADLTNQLRDIPVNTWVEVVFTGETKKLKGGRTLKIYDVFVDRMKKNQADSYSVDEEEGDDSFDFSDDEGLPPVANTQTLASVQTRLNGRATRS